MSSEYDQIHDAVRLDPESVWERMREFLCSSATGPSAEVEHLERVDVIEDLMFSHADAFIDRLEALVGECPALLADIVSAHVGGVAAGPGLERFYALQDALAADLEANGELTTWKGFVPFNID